MLIDEFIFLLEFLSPILMLDSILITHTDLDGIAAAVLAVNSGLVRTVHAWMNGYYDGKVFDGFDKVYVVDRCLEPFQIDELERRGKDVIILDHHASSSWLSDYETCLCDCSRCGTKLLWEEILDDVPNEFVDAVDAYDRWEKECSLFNKGNDLNRLFESQVSYASIRAEMIYDQKQITRSSFSKIIPILQRLFTDFHFNDNDLSLIAEMKRKEDEAYEIALRNLKIRTDRRGVRYAIFEGGKQMSIVANRILDLNPGIKYVLAYFPNSPRKLSARARKGEFNLITLKGMQGHPAASGCQLDPGEIKAIIRGRELGYK